MPKYAYQANLSYQDGRLIGAEGEFHFEEAGAAALDALVSDLKNRHNRGGEIPQVTVSRMYPTAAE